MQLLGLAHLVLLALWGGVVGAEAVIELYPFRRPELHHPTVRLHYWIDLLVELPLILAVVATGVTLLALVRPLTPWHLVKVAIVAVPVSANLVCIALVVARRRRLEAGASDESLWRLSKRIVASAAVGLPFAAVGAGLGLWLALQRLAHP